MSKYYRQCPNCGGRTVETTCELCGRNTCSTDTKYEEKNSATMEENSMYGFNNEQQVPKEGHSLQKKLPISNSPKSIIVSIIIIAFVVSLPLIYSAIQSAQEEEEYRHKFDNINEQYDFFENYLVTVQEEIPLICEVDEIDEEWIHVSNSTPYFFDADVEFVTDAGKDKTNIYLGTPYTKESQVVPNIAKSCEVINTKYQYLNIYESDVVYEILFDDAYTETLLLQEDISEEELELLLKRIYAIHILTFNTYEGSLKILVNNKQAYIIEIDYQKSTIFVTNLSNNQKSEIIMDIV